MKFFLDRATLANLAAQLEAGLRALNFRENFSSFTWSGTIEPGDEIAIKNGLGQHVPTGMVIESQSAPLIAKGDTEWTSDYVSIKNVGTNSTVEAEVTFYK